MRDGCGSPIAFEVHDLRPEHPRTKWGNRETANASSRAASARGSQRRAGWTCSGGWKWIGKRQGSKDSRPSCTSEANWLPSPASATATAFACDLTVPKDIGLVTKTPVEQLMIGCEHLRGWSSMTYFRRVTANSRAGQNRGRRSAVSQMDTCGQRSTRESWAFSMSCPLPAPGP
jgi:hypothetical protein